MKFADEFKEQVQICSNNYNKNNNDASNKNDDDGNGDNGNITWDL